MRKGSYSSLLYLVDPARDHMQAHDEQYMRAALEQAHLAKNCDEVPIGAVVVFRDDIVGSGYNQTRMLNDPTAHAEVQALRIAATKLNNFRLNDVSLYVTVEPCLMCSGALLEARIARLIYGTREPKTGAVVSTAEALMAPRCQHHIAVTEGVLQDECAQLMKAFFKHKR